MQKKWGATLVHGKYAKKVPYEKKANEVKERRLKFSLSMNAKNQLKKGSQRASIHLRTIGIRWFNKEHIKMQKIERIVN